MGHKVILVPPQHVKPFVRGGKNDARDALAICEAAQRPDMHPVPIKSVEQKSRHPQLTKFLLQRAIFFRKQEHCSYKNQLFQQ
jgi:transposase